MKNISYEQSHAHNLFYFEENEENPLTLLIFGTFVYFYRFDRHLDRYELWMLHWKDGQRCFDNCQLFLTWGEVCETLGEAR